MIFKCEIVISGPPYPLWLASDWCSGAGSYLWSVVPVVTSVKPRSMDWHHCTSLTSVNQSRLSAADRDCDSLLLETL